MSRKIQIVSDDGTLYHFERDTLFPEVLCRCETCGDVFRTFMAIVDGVNDGSLSYTCRGSGNSHFGPAVHSSTDDISF